MDQKEYFMKEALLEAKKAYKKLEIPVGAVIVKDGEIISQLPLPIAGLMSDRDFDYVVGKCDELNNAAKSIGCTLMDPFMTMGFLSLPVIPELKITDKGVFDTDKLNFVDIFEPAVLKK